MSQFSVACLQMELSGSDNLAALGAEIVLTKQRYPWVDMVVLSELCVNGPSIKHAQVFPSEAEQYFCSLAREHDLWLIPGSQFERDGDQVFNTASVINNRGEVVERYRKIFPFYPYETGVTPGHDFVVFDVPAGCIAVAICYDLWFPEVARSLVFQGAEAIIYPTMTGTIDREIELVMARSTAAMNQCYVLAVNGAGDYGNGQSIVAGPEGKVVHQASVSHECIPVEIDFSLVRRTRERGIFGLGQPLKSIRDCNLDFPYSHSTERKKSKLSDLGELSVSGRYTQAKSDR
ncbi:carbon-nitrogen hydrolase family protein [Shewanella sp.]|uniref:carbon-nitrogen hydrolase family protein n=1 Tax=Shewanella sp. TaxID=50422 RepID=UPI001EC90027|nr:carbon-nitrogen hydrolase family protein [Shewanella sp.]NRB22636.1 carbon-nitrogen hydrolase family protein [Shewanella sp.]